jgi:hypothetical protein
MPRIGMMWEKASTSCTVNYVPGNFTLKTIGDAAS